MSGKCGETGRDWHQITRKLIFVNYGAKVTTDWPVMAAQMCDDKLFTFVRQPLAKHSMDVAYGFWAQGSSTLSGRRVSVLCVLLGEHRRGEAGVTGVGVCKRYNV